MGTIYYGGSAMPIHIEDRTLAHLTVVVATKLRRNESFTLSWPHADHQPSGTLHTVDSSVDSAALRLRRPCAHRVEPHLDRRTLSFQRTRPVASSWSPSTSTVRRRRPARPPTFSPLN